MLHVDWCIHRCLQDPVENIVYKDVIKYVNEILERELQVPVEIEKRVEVAVAFKKIVIFPSCILEFPTFVLPQFRQSPRRGS